MILALLLAALIPVTPGTYYKYGRDNVLLASTGHLTLLAQIVPGTPFGGGGGGGGGTPGGANTNIQYNNASSFGGSANFTWNNGTSTFTVVGTSVLAGEIQQSANSQLWTGAATGGGAIFRASADTPDTFKLTTGSLSNAIVICEDADKAFDFAHGIQTNPTLFIQSADGTSTTKWISIAHDGTNGALLTGTGNIATTTLVTPDAPNAGIHFGSTGTGRASLTEDFQNGGTIAAGMMGVADGAGGAHYWVMADKGDITFNFAHAATTNPTLFIQSADAVTTEYMGLSTDNSVGMGQIATLKGGDYIGGSKTNITEGSAQAIATFTMAALGSFGATVFYTVSDNNGTDIISRSGNIVIQGVDKAGTTTCTIATTRDQETEDGSSAAVSGGALTLTYTWTMVAASNTCAMSLNGASNAGANTYDITYNIQLMADAAITVTPN